MGLGYVKQPVRDVKILAQGSYTHTGDGTFKDIANFNVPILAQGDTIIIEAVCSRTAGVDTVGAVVDLAAGNSELNRVCNAAEASVVGTLKLSTSPNTVTQSTYNKIQVTVAGLITGGSSADLAGGFNFSAPEVIYIKSWNSAAGTNSKIAYVAYLIKSGQ